MSGRKKYSKEFKLDAVSLVLEQNYSRAEAARSLELNSNMLGRWVAEHRDGNGQIRLQDMYATGVKRLIYIVGAAPSPRYSKSRCKLTDIAAGAPLLQYISAQSTNCSIRAQSVAGKKSRSRFNASRRFSSINDVDLINCFA